MGRPRSCERAKGTALVKLRDSYPSPALEEGSKSQGTQYRKDVDSEVLRGRGQLLGAGHWVEPRVCSRKELLAPLARADLGCAV